ncbi:MAG TPA: alpha/beta hydrolase [Steroidobacteraceae bacterium]|nr:alpha/beta hydrolase [Steroidobacteraceae bacterium]
MPHPYTEIAWRSHDALELYARLYEGPRGGAPTVLCLHGLTRNSRDFEDLAPHLDRRYRVIVPDLRGRGFSARDPQPQNYQPAVYVKDILGLLDSLGAPRVAIIGTSLGGMLAMMLGFSEPARVAAIVLNDVGPEIDPVGIERIKQYAGRLPPARTWNEAVAQTRAVYGDAWPDLALDRWQVLARRGYREDAAGGVVPDADPGIGDAIRAAPAATLDLWPLWKALLDIPMLAIRGARSDILSAATFSRMKSENPRLQQLEVANRGHVPLLDEPECIAALDLFLSRTLSVPPV